MTAARPKLDPADYARAERAANRQRGEGLTFGSVRHALQWHAEAGPRMQSPKGMHPRSQRAKDGSMVVVDVEGGRGSNLDEVLATLATIQAEIGAAHRYDHRGTDMLLRVIRGETMTEVGKAYQVSQQQVSIEVGRAQAFLAGRLSAAGVVG